MAKVGRGVITCNGSAWQRGVYHQGSVQYMYQQCMAKLGMGMTAKGCLPGEWMAKVARGVGPAVFGKIRNGYDSSVWQRGVYQGSVQ